MTGGAVTLLMVALLTIPLLADTHEQDLERIRGEITSLKGRLEEMKAKTKTAEEELEAADLELGIRTRELEIATKTQEALELEQRGVEAQIAGIAPRIQRQKHILSQRLVALYRMGGLSYFRLILSIDERRDPLRAMSMLTYLVGRDARTVSRFRSMRGELEQRYAQLADRKRQVVEARHVVEARQRDVATARADKERLVASLHSQSVASARQLAVLEEKAKRLERLVGLLTRQARPENPADGDVRSFQGALGWPVAGHLVETFGKQRDPRFATVTFNNGVKVSAPVNAEVRAVFSGTVLFSQWFKGYGNLIIVDHGNRVFTLYGNVKAPRVAQGDHVTTGQPIAGVGESEEPGTGFLYFEVRQDNRPEDPQKWLR